MSPWQKDTLARPAARRLATASEAADRSSETKDAPGLFPARITVCAPTAQPAFSTRLRRIARTRVQQPGQRGRLVGQRSVSPVEYPWTQSVVIGSPGGRCRRSMVLAWAGSRPRTRNGQPVTDAMADDRPVLVANRPPVQDGDDGWELSPGAGSQGCARRRGPIGRGGRLGRGHEGHR